MTKVTLRPTIAADLSAFAAEPLPFRILAITLLIDGKVKAVGGLAFPPGEPVWVFMDQVAGIERYPIAIHRAGIAGMKLIHSSGLNEIVATVDPGNPKALRWIRRFGFVEAAQQSVDGRIVFVWTRDAAD